MNQLSILELAAIQQQKARQVLEQSGIASIWEKAGCRVQLIGSVRMGLLINHRDIDLHVYSEHITEAHSFAIAAQMARIPEVKDLTCINGLHTDEHCMEWHLHYQYGEETWKFDIIHIEADTLYDGYFEQMADRIVELATPEQLETILRLKYETPETETIIGAEYYEAVLTAGVTTLPELRAWLKERRQKEPYYWMP